MNPQNRLSIRLSALATAALFSAGLTTANATEPCDDFGECKVLIEMNTTDGDIGFHFLVDGDNLIRTVLFNAKHRRIFSYVARRELRRQFLTEHPFCVMCEDEGRVTLAIELDHIQKHNGDPVLFYDINNLQGLCFWHHRSFKSQMERSGSVRGCTADGTPIDPNHSWYNNEAQ